MFDGSTEPSIDHSDGAKGLGEWPGTVERLPAQVVPHMGWNTVDPPDGSVLFTGVQGERFYFLHSYAVQRWEFETRDGQVAHFTPPAVTWAEHGARFVAAVENGPLSATQFHPEKSGDAGAQLLRNWVRSL
jgi:glutamine amidotransferase